MGSLQEVLEKMESFSDVVLISNEGVDYKLHKGVLARFSDFFKDMFSTLSPSEKRVGVDLSSSDLETLLKCMYVPGALNVNNEEIFSVDANNLHNLVEAARKYQMPEVLEACDDYCCQKEQFLDSGIARLLGFACEYKLTKLFKKCEERLDRGNLAVIIRQAEGLDSLHDEAKSKLLLAAAEKLQKANDAKARLNSNQTWRSHFTFGDMSVVQVFLSS